MVKTSQSKKVPIPTPRRVISTVTRRGYTGNFERLSKSMWPTSRSPHESTLVTGVLVFTGLRFSRIWKF